MDPQEENIFRFDHNFYITTYTDLDINEYNTQEKSLAHYLRWGKREGRCCCYEQMINQYQKNKTESIEKINLFPKLEKKKFNILIRTSSRPEYFKKCIESVLNQTYTNYNIFICFDKKESLKYLTPYKNNSKIDFFCVKEESVEKYKFNLYCNHLLDRVDNGYCFFLDDDNIMLSERVLEMLNWCSGNYKIITWKFLRPDRLIYKEDLNTPLILGEIDTSNVCFCSSIKNDSQWLDKQYGDFNYFKPLFDSIDIKYKYFFDYTLTGTQFNDRIGNFGENI
jgi:hypothetical protein